MIVGDLVKVRGLFVEEYGWISDILMEDSIIINVVVTLFSGKAEMYHPSRVKLIQHNHISQKNWREK